MEDVRPPAFFLSSTIYDFKDLRSALKYYLEKQGCSVLASEYNDLPKALDVHSYEACLRAITAADYFVLFIGARVGGWYDKVNKVSITQQEYREAYKLHKAGKLKIIAFVRSEVWQVREDRKALGTYLNSLEIAEELKKTITEYPSRFASDSQFIADFINEVSRNRETLAASGSGGDFPTGNWIHVFHEFSEVIDALQTLVFAGLPAEDSAIRKLLSIEIIEILRVCLYKSKDSVFLPEPTIQNFADHYRLDPNTRMNPVTVVEAMDWAKISSLTVHVMRVSLQPIAIPRVLTSTAFLTFDISTGLMRETPVYRGLYLLAEEIRKFMFLNTPDVVRVVFTNVLGSRLKNGEPVSVSIPTPELAALLHLLDRWINIAKLCVAISKYLAGEQFTMPRLRPRSPFYGMDDELEKEEPTTKEAQAFVADQP